MSKEQFTWKEVEACFKGLGYHIVPCQGDMIICSPKKNSKGKRDTVRITNACCFCGSAIVTRPFLQQLESVFRVTPTQIKEGNS